MSAAPEVIVGVEAGGVGRLTLNRPAALNALTTGMCEAMIEALVAWRDDAAVSLVLIDHAGERGFCAGGDIRMLAESGAGDGAAAREFFFAEYRLNELLSRYRKPIVAVMDGVTMGGGVGLSMPARYRVTSERTSFAMPETGIGLFPDVGAGWYLPRLPGEAGIWLALTGARVRAADCVRLRIATHYVESAKLAEVKAALGDGGPAALAALASDPGPAPIEPRLGDIARLFAGDSVEAIIAALKADGSDWAKAQLEALAAKSPQTLKVALRLLREGIQLGTLAPEMMSEYRIATRLVRRHDFLEGVRAVIVDKDNAQRWSPATLDEVTPALLDQIFAPLPGDVVWTPVPD